MLQVEGLNIEQGIDSVTASKEVVKFVGIAAARLADAGLSNRWQSGDRTENHLFYTIAPGEEVEPQEWDKAYNESLSRIQVKSGKIYTRTETGSPTYASVMGTYAHTALMNQRVVESAADSWHARLFIPIPHVDEPQRVIMDSWRMPMTAFWQRANDAVLRTDEEVADYDKWCRTWRTVDSMGIPIRAKNFNHDVIGRPEPLNNGARRRFNWFMNQIDMLVSNVCETTAYNQESYSDK